MTEQEMKEYMMKFGGSLHVQILGMFTELKNEIHALKDSQCSCKDTKPKVASKTTHKKR